VALIVSVTLQDRVEISLNELQTMKTVRFLSMVLLPAVWNSLQLTCAQQTSQRTFLRK